MRIYFDARYDLEDVSNGSGSFYFLIRNLRAQGAEVITGTPTLVRRPFLCQARNFYYRRLLGRQYHYFMESPYARRLAKAVSRNLRRERFDVLFTNDRNVAAYYPGTRPVVLVTDNIFRATVGSQWYERYQNLCARNLRNGDRVQELALKRALHTFVPSQWVHEHAIRSHGGNPHAVRFVRWGANLLEIPDGDVAASRGVPRRTDVRLLSVGLDWRRKQGDLLLEMAAALRKRGIAVHLTMVGMSPPGGVPGGVTLLAPLRKGNASDRAQLSHLYRNAHFFVLPTRAEGYGMVFVEAAAHALPSVALRLTGVESSVLDGVSGVLLDPEARAEQFADLIEKYLDCPDEYLCLCRSARGFYDSEANWPRAAREILNILESSLQ
jgi:glycosyltransferase involved in cell wall biosynthesis